MTILHHPAADFFPFGPMNPPRALPQTPPRMDHILAMYRVEKALCDRLRDIRDTLHSAGGGPKFEAAYDDWEKQNAVVVDRRTQLLARLDADYGVGVGEAIKRTLQDD